MCDHADGGARWTREPGSEVGAANEPAKKNGLRTVVSEALPMSGMV